MWSVGKGLNFPLATPAYLKRHGTPEKPEDLTNHNLILRTGRNYPPSYFLSRGNEKAPLITKHVVFTGDALSCKAALMSTPGSQWTCRLISAGRKSSGATSFRAERLAQAPLGDDVRHDGAPSG